MTPVSAARRPFLRAMLAALVVADLIFLFFVLPDARALALASGIVLNPCTDLLSRAAGRGVVVLIGVGGAVAFGWRPGRLWEGVVALGALAVLSTVHAQLFGSPWRHLYYSGLCLSGWLLGLAVSRRHGAPTDESYARIGSIALLGAAYLNAGISKIAFGGGDWVSGVPIQTVILGQDGMVADSAVSIYRSWVVNTPLVASLFSFATVGFELAGPLMLAGRRTRLGAALGLFAMHANIYVLTGILYWEAMVFLVMFGLSADGQLDPAALPPVMIRGGDRRFTGSVALLTLCAFLAIGHQSRRYARLYAEPPGYPAGSMSTGLPATAPSTPPLPGMPPAPPFR